jgi:hypothetical protein
MTKHQKIAFERPCLNTEQCAAQDYAWLRPPWSTILTLNVGLDDAWTFEGLPLWHCSVAVVDLNADPLALAFWHDDAFAECVRLVRLELLAGVGDPTREQIEIGNYALHFRRCCSHPETRELNIRGVWPRTQDRARRN